MAMILVLESLLTFQGNLTSCLMSCRDLQHKCYTRHFLNFLKSVWAVHISLSPAVELMLSSGRVICLPYLNDL